MRRWIILIALLLALTLSVVVVRHRSDKLEQHKREVGYQSALRAYSDALHPGMTRKDVEDYLGARSVGFRHMCCVELKDFSKGVYDDLVKVGQEDAPWFCSEKNVYVALQFRGTARNETGPEADPTDTLEAVTLYRWLEGCM